MKLITISWIINYVSGFIYNSIVYYKNIVFGISENKNITIEKLNDDCLTTIFRLLPIMERVKIERVNKRWNEIAKSSWGNVKKINLYTLSWGFRTGNVNKLLKVLERCGQYIEETEIEIEDIKLTGFEIHNLTNALKRMKNLKKISVSLYGNTANDVIVVLHGCFNLEDIELIANYDKEDFPDEEKKLGILFKNNKKLKVLSMYNFYYEGECLMSLNYDCVKVLRLSGLRYLNPKYLLKFNNLIEFEYCYKKIGTNEDSKLIKFISGLAILNTLKLDGPYSNNDLFLFKESLKNLKKVALSGESGPSEVTDSGLRAITGILNLEDLSLCEMEKITDNGFSKMKNLKKLKCLHCPYIGNDGLKQVLIESEKLDHLQITYCPITEDLLLFANEITKKRSNNIILYINRGILSQVQTENFKNIEKSEFLDFTEDIISFYDC